MDEEKDFIKVEYSENQRTPMGTGTTTMNITIPRWIKRLIEEEARAQNKSKSLVVTYLIYSGLKAHVGEFVKPHKNLIRERYERRGKKWS